MLKLKDDAGVEKVASQSVSLRQENMEFDDFENFDEPYVSPSLKLDGLEASTKTDGGYVLETDDSFGPRMNAIEADERNNTANNNQVVKEEKKSNPLASIAVLVGFAAWIGALFYFSKTEPKFCISTFGAFWLVIAVVVVAGFIKNGIQDIRNLIIGFIFVYLGVGLTFVPILQLYVPRFGGEFGFRMAMYLVFIFCIIVGTLMISAEAYRIIRSHKMCTVQVSAQCLKLRDKHFWRDEVDPRETIGYWGRRKKVSGVYQFEYNGKTYEVQDDTNSNMNRPMPGELVKLYINPKNPNEFYREMVATRASVFIIGISFLVVGIICCVVF